MKVILLQKVAGLGDADDIKDVSEGYARNFLFPRHLAVLASSGAVQNAHSRRQRESKNAETQLHQEQSLAGRLDGLELEFKQKSGPGGQLYAAIGAQKISERLASLGFSVRKNQINAPAIKTAGDYRVKVKLSHGLEPELKVVVTTV